MAGFDFDMIVIGGGSAGLTASGIAANFGAKTMMIEKDRLGGDCTWHGCVPSKALLKAGKIARTVQKAEDYGIHTSSIEIDFSKVMGQVHQIREEVYQEADHPDIYENMGIEVVFGEASFVDKHTVEIKSGESEIRQVSSSYFIIATGAGTFIPPVPGLNTINYLTTDTLFEIDQLPEELIIVGAGPVGIEMAQSFNNLGSGVMVVDMAGQILTGEDPELSEILKDQLEEEGIQFRLNTSLQEVSPQENGVQVMLGEGGEREVLQGTNLLMATGRKAHTKGLNLEAAGISTRNGAIRVNDSCRTSVKHIYAAGDVTGEYQFTHMSEHMAKIAATRALIKYPISIERDYVPRVTYTEPELAHVGAMEKELKEHGKKFQVYRFPYSKIDRAMTEKETRGLIKIYARKWSGKILGASVVGAHAGELISEYALAMRNGVSLRDIADTIHPYPSWGQGARRAADQWYIKNQSEWSVKLIKKVFGYKGDIPDFSDKNRIV